jgi:hypothetical protein
VFFGVSNFNFDIAMKRRGQGGPLTQEDINRFFNKHRKSKGIWLGADHFSAQYRTKLWLASPDLIC